MSRGGSSGGGRSSLGYLFEPAEIAPNPTIKSNQETDQKAPVNNCQDDKMSKEAANHQEPYPVRPKKLEGSNPIVSHSPASNIYHTNGLSQNAGILITTRPSTKVRCVPGGPSSLGFLFGDQPDQ